MYKKTAKQDRSNDETLRSLDVRYLRRCLDYHQDAASVLISPKYFKKIISQNITLRQENEAAQTLYSRVFAWFKLI
jgi:hypothetical protein